MTSIPRFRGGETIGSGGSDTPTYRITDVVGVGGVGQIYAASVLATSERVVLKLPRDWDFFYDITQECRYLAGQRLPHVARCRGLDWAPLPDGPEVLFLVTDYYPSTLSGALREHLKVHKRPVPIPLAVRWIRQIAQGLQATQLVHRDLKPANIFIDSEQQAWVGDFGLAIPANPVVRNQSGIDANGLVGTYMYMAIEQMLEWPLIDVRADIYSLGLILFELVTGVPARPKKPRDQDENRYLMMLLDWKIQLGQILDPRVRVIVETATQAKPADRYQDYWSLLSDLDGLG